MEQSILFFFSALQPAPPGRRGGMNGTGATGAVAGGTVWVQSPSMVEGKSRWCRQEELAGSRACTSAGRGCTGYRSSSRKRPVGLGEPAWTWVHGPPGRDRQTERVYRLRGGPGWEGLSPRVHKLLTKLQVQGLGTPVIRHLTFATPPSPRYVKKQFPLLTLQCAQHQPHAPSSRPE